MILEGTLVNGLAILIGSLIGVLIGGRLSPKIDEHLKTALGLCVLAIGMQMTHKFQQILLMLGCVTVGGMIGGHFEIENKIERLGEQLQKRLKGLGSESFSKGFSVASILYCTGAMAIIGAFDSGLKLNHEILYTKALLDGLISISFAAFYGIGVAFSLFPVILYQGSLAFLASGLDFLTNAAVLDEMTAVGGVLLMMIGLRISGIKEIKVGDFLPAIILVFIFAPIIHLSL